MEKRFIDPWGEFEIDPRTNLPAVPEGFFWRVVPSSETYLRMELCRNTGKLFRPVEIISLTVINKDEPLTLEYHAAYIISCDPRKAQAEADIEAQKLIGYYPPRRA